jgi:hypothetical protein
MLLLCPQLVTFAGNSAAKAAWRFVSQMAPNFPQLNPLHGHPLIGPATFVLQTNVS